jgi:hypothetical protein
MTCTAAPEPLASFMFADCVSETNLIIHRESQPNQWR